MILHRDAQCLILCVYCVYDTLVAAISGAETTLSPYCTTHHISCMTAESPWPIPYSVMYRRLLLGYRNLSTTTPELMQDRPNPYFQSSGIRSTPKYLHPAPQTTPPALHSSSHLPASASFSGCLRPLSHRPGTYPSFSCPGRYGRLSCRRFRATWSFLGPVSDLGASFPGGSVFAPPSRTRLSKIRPLFLRTSVDTSFSRGLSSSSSSYLP